MLTADFEVWDEDMAVDQRRAGQPVLAMKVRL